MRALLPILCLALVGCGSLSYTVKEYGVQRPVAYRSPQQNTWIIDQPDRGRMLVMLGPMSAFGHGYAQGVTLGLAHVMDLKEDMTATAQSYLASTGRKARTTSARELLRGQWEVTYELHR